MVNKTDPKLQEHSMLLAAVTTRLEAEIMSIGGSSSAAFFVVSTPIGNLSDITLRALAVLKSADVIYAEDTRHSGQLLSHYGIATRQKSSHDHNEESRVSEVVRRLEAGEKVALITDAGTPLISDPGFKLVRAIAQAGFPVVSVPGASALLAGITSSGLPTDSFMFVGFLSSKQTARKKRLSELVKIPTTLVFYESPSRIQATIRDLAELLGDGRQAALGRELTKRYEEILRGTLGEISTQLEDTQRKGEMVIVVSPPEEIKIDDDYIRGELSHALATSSLKDAARQVSEDLGVSKSRVYELGLEIKRNALSNL